MPSPIDSALPDYRFAAWLCLCPLLAAASSWPLALTLAICLLLTIALTLAALAALRRFVSQSLQLPLGALLAGTLAVLEQLALATWWADLDAAVAPWLLLVAGLTVLVCCFDENLHEERTLTATPMGEGFVAGMKLAIALSVALLLIGVARDAFGRVFLLADTPVGALVLLALGLATIHVVNHPALPTQRTTPPARGKGGT